MCDVNPYASPTTPADDEVTSVPYQVDGPYLIVKSGVRLPMRCVLTNQPTTDDDLVRRRLIWAPSFRLVLSRYRCNLEYCINAMRRRQIFIWTKLVPFLAVAIILGGGILLQLFSGILLLLAIVGMMVLTRFGPRDPLKIKRALGQRFWIEGISPDFLADCAGDFDRPGLHNFGE